MAVMSGDASMRTSQRAPIPIVVSNSSDDGLSGPPYTGKWSTVPTTT